MVYGILLVLQVFVAIGLIVLVLIQQGKGADAGAAFGSGASATVFGAQGSGNFLSRMTTVFAVLFFINSLSLAYIVVHRPTEDSVVDRLQGQGVEIDEALPGEAERPPVIPEDIPAGEGRGVESARVPLDVPD